MQEPITTYLFFFRVVVVVVAVAGMPYCCSGRLKPLHKIATVDESRKIPLQKGTENSKRKIRFIYSLPRPYLFHIILLEKKKEKMNGLSFSHNIISN